MDHNMTSLEEKINQIINPPGNGNGNGTIPATTDQVSEVSTEALLELYERERRIAFLSGLGVAVVGIGIIRMFSK